MKPILLFILIVYCLAFVIVGFYMRNKKNRKAAGNTYIVVGLLGVLFGMVYHFFSLKSYVIPTITRMVLFS